MGHRTLLGRPRDTMAFKAAFVYDSAQFFAHIARTSIPLWLLNWLFPKRGRERDKRERKSRRSHQPKRELVPQKSDCLLSAPEGM